MDDIFTVTLTKPAARFQSRYNADIQRLSDIIQLDPSFDTQTKLLKIQQNLQRQLESLIYSALKSPEYQQAFPLLCDLPLLNSDTPKAEELTLRKGKSLQGNDAGEGVLVDCSSYVAQGRLVTLYQGVSYQEVDLLLINSIQPAMLTENQYLLTRYDNIVIDGSPEEKSAQMYAAVAKSTTTLPSDHHALGAFINHSKHSANVIPIGIDVVRQPNASSRLWHELCRFLPAKPFRDSNTDISKQVAFISVIPIDGGDEILFDYNFSVGPERKELPSWYK